jgi:dihydroorotase
MYSTARRISSIPARAADRALPSLKLVFEHITTARAVEFVRGARAGVAATITPQHLLHNRNAIFAGGIRPHFYCLPILKRESDRQALVAARRPAAIRASSSAPTARRTSAPPRRAPAAAPACSRRTPRSNCTRRPSKPPAAWTGCRRSQVTSARTSMACRAARDSDPRPEPWRVPATIDFAGGSVVPYRAGEFVQWRLARPDAP